MQVHGQLRQLESAYPDAKYYLDFDSPYHLVLAAILSAQCTDVIVNKATPALFRKYKEPKDAAAASEEEILSFIQGITYAGSKAGYIKKASLTLVEEFNGEVPKEIDQLTRLAGVGKKTANAIQQNAFDIVNGVVVDTHVIRVSNRLGWTKNKDPKKIEEDLMELFPKEHWKKLPHLLKNHGRKTCTARRPKCADCFLNATCPSAFKV